MAGAWFKLQVKKVMQSGSVIAHWGKLVEGTLENDSFSKVNCEIDWDWRFLMMRRHSTAHLLDHCLANAMRRDVDASDSWLGNPCYVAYHGPLPSPEVLSQAEELENRMMSEGRTVGTEQVSVEEATRRFQNETRILQGLRRVEEGRVVMVGGWRPLERGGGRVIEKDQKERGRWCR